MKQMKKRVASIALAGVMLFGSGFLADTNGVVGFLPIKPIIAMAETSEFTVNGISYQILFDDIVYVRGCRAMTTVNIPSMVECFGKKYKVASIQGTAFKNNDSINTINIPESVDYIDESTFTGCTNLKSININANNKYYSSYDGVFYDKNKTQLYKYPSNKTSSSFSIPSTVNSIYGYAFDKCYYLETVTIPKDTNYIALYAFNNCRKLKEINVNSSNNYFCSVGGVLYTKDKTRLVKYPGALLDTSFSVPKTVKEIETGAFLEAGYLSSIDVESGNTSFKAESGVLFNYKKDILVLYPAAKDGKVYTVPSSVTDIETYAFANSIVTDLRNMSKGINASTFFMDYSSITHINGSNSLTSNNAGFVLSNLDYLRNTKFIINAVNARVKEAQNYLKNNYQKYKNYHPKATDEVIKAMIMHDWLCENVMYVPDTLTAYKIYGIPSEQEQSNYKYAAYISSGATYDSINKSYYVDDLSSSRYHNAIGALLMPFTVCEGYAKAYQLLLKSVSVECEVVNDAKNTHVWNVVIIGGKYYSVDCTFDDNDNGSSSYNHFLKSHDYLNQMNSRYDNPKVLSHAYQLELIYNVLGTKHLPESYDYIKANSAASNYSF